MSKWFVLALSLAAPGAVMAQPAKAPPKAAASTAAPAAIAPELAAARAAILKKNWKAAQAALEPYVASDPDNGVAQATLAHVLMVQGKAHYAKALEHFMIAAKLLPDSDEVHYGRGAVFMLMGQPRETEKEHRWLVGRGRPLGPWLAYVMEDKRLPDPLRGIIGVEPPKPK
jgi:Tfp pilus assembly protein PilF